jgi:hypothetical protein
MTYGIWGIPVNATPTTLCIPQVLGTAFLTPTTPTVDVSLAVKGITRWAWENPYGDWGR